MEFLIDEIVETWLLEGYESFEFFDKIFRKLCFHDSCS